MERGLKAKKEEKSGEFEEHEEEDKRFWLSLPLCLVRREEEPVTGILFATRGGDERKVAFMETVCLKQEDTRPAPLVAAIAAILYAISYYEEIVACRWTRRER